MKNFFKQKRLNIEDQIDFSTIEGCRQFLNNIYIGNDRVKGVSLANGQYVKMEDIPDSQVRQRAKELRDAIKGKNKNI